MAALTGYNSVKVLNRTVFGNKRIVTGYVVFGDGSSYWPTGGIAFSGSDIGIGGIDFIMFTKRSIQYVYDYTNKKIDGYINAVDNTAQAKAGAAETIPLNEQCAFFCIGHGKG
jgi:hypothetical protein